MVAHPDKAMAASLLKSGQQVAGYEVITLVGKGGMGEVYRARQLSMDRIVALKVLAPKLIKRDPTFAQSFVDEARSAGRLNHPNIVGVHDVGQSTLTTEAGEEPVHYFSMEFVEGETVKDIIGKVGAMPITQIGQIISAMVEALVYAEAQGVVHRDIKPENIMVSPNGEVKLADLGLAQEVGSENQDTEGKGRKVMGTPMYMSPEQARGMAVGHASDQYSLGATLYTMLTGQPPFTGSDGRALMKAHVREPVPDPKLIADIPEGWRTLCMRMMAKEVADRYPSAVDLRAVVKLAIAGVDDLPRRVRTGRVPTQAGQAQVATEPGMPPAIRNAVIAAIIVAVVLVALAVVPWSGSSSPTPTSMPVKPTDGPTLVDTGGDQSLSRAKALVRALSDDHAAAIGRLDKALSEPDVSASAREVLQTERTRRQQTIAAQEQALTAAQIAVLDRIDGRIASGQFAQARSEFDAAAAEKPDRVAKRRAETAARFEQALAGLVDQLQKKITAAGDEQTLRRVEGEIAAAPLAPAQRGKLAEAILARQGQLAKNAQLTALAAAAGPRWAALADAIEPLRYTSRFDDLRAVISTAADGFPTPDTQAQAKALLDLATYGQKGEAALRAHVKTRMPVVTMRVNRELKKPAIIGFTDKDIQIRPISGAPSRLDRQTTVLDYRPLLIEALSAVEAKERERTIAAFLYLWDPPNARAAFKALGDDPLARAVAEVDSRRKGPLLAGRVLRQEAGRVQVIYDFLPGDTGLLADFAADGLELNDRGVAWKNTKNVPKDTFTEASLATVRWKGRLHPPLKISATLRLVRETQGALAGVDAGGKFVRLVFNTKSLPGMVAVGTLLTGEADKFSAIGLNKVSIDLSQPVDASVDDKRRLTLSYNGTVVEKDRQIADGSVGWVFQLYQIEGASTFDIETLNLEGKWAE